MATFDINTMNNIDDMSLEFHVCDIVEPDVIDYLIPVENKRLIYYDGLESPENFNTGPEQDPGVLKHIENQAD